MTSMSTLDYVDVASLDTSETRLSQLVVYGGDGNEITVTGVALSFMVEGGALVIQDGGQSIFAFGAGQWQTVNVRPTRT